FQSGSDLHEGSQDLCARPKGLIRSGARRLHVGPGRRGHVCLPSSTTERVKPCGFIFSSRKRREACGPSQATSGAASSRRTMVPGPPPARSARTTLLPITSLGVRSKKQSMPKDFSSGASRKPKRRPEANCVELIEDRKHDGADILTRLSRRS